MPAGARFGWVPPGKGETFARAANSPDAKGLAFSFVRRSVPLLDARSSAFLEGAVVDGITIQPLQLVLADSTVVVALYRMEKQKDGLWRVAGCVIAPSKAQAT